MTKQKTIKKVDWAFAHLATQQAHTRFAGAFEGEDSISRSERKRRMEALQDIASVIVELPPERFKKMELPEAIQKAAAEARKIKEKTGRRRQIHYVGRLVRALEPDVAQAILAQLEASAIPDQRANTIHQTTEEWRDKLMDEPNGQDLLMAEFPVAKPFADTFFTLIEKAQLERSAGRPPKFQRELFRAVREVLNLAMPTPDADEDDSD